MGKQQRQFELIAPFLDALEQLGTDSKQFFARYQERWSPPDPKSGISGDDFVLMLESAVETSGDPGFAIRLGQTINICKRGAFGFALMSCATYRDTVVLLRSYQEVLAPGPYWEPLLQDDGMIARLGPQRGNAEQQRLVTELALSLNISHYQFLTSASLEGVEIELNYPEPGHGGTSMECLSVPVAHNREYSQMRISEHVLSMPVRTAEPAVNVLYRQQCEEILQGMEKADSTTSEVRKIMLQASDGFPDISSVARQLSVSERTLRRRLKNESTNFRTVLEDVNEVLARRYLVDTRLEVPEIASLLGYSEPANFYRAFARWTGKTPAEYRYEQD